MRKRTLIEMRDHEMEELVSKHLPKYKGHSFAATQECGNDSQHTFTIDGKISEWDRKQLDAGRASNDTLLNQLCADGVIESGEYLIMVCW